MGETGLASFIPILVDELENETMTACYSLGKISEDASVTALISMLENDDRYVREAAVWSLGNITYGADLEDSKADALEALNDRLELEEETWIVEMIEAAIILIETGLITDSVFDVGVEN
jgi:HEAT repeat protein